MLEVFRRYCGSVEGYTIGVEVLGRSHDFDPKKDSIVRVQAHRLREHLTGYYRAEGANHAVHIAIPPRSYTPRFIFQRVPAAEIELLSPPPAITVAERPERETRRTRTRFVALGFWLSQPQRSYSQFCRTGARIAHTQESCNRGSPVNLNR